MIFDSWLMLVDGGWRFGVSFRVFFFGSFDCFR